MASTQKTKRRCEGCGVQFRPRLEGTICPACVGLIIKHGLDPDDWEQHELQEEYA